MKNLRQTASAAVFIAMSSHALASSAQNIDDKDTQGSASTHAQVEASFDRMPDEILAQVLHHLPSNDLNKFGAMSKQFSQKKVAYQENLANCLIPSIQRDQEDDWSSLVNRQLQALDYLKGFKDASNQSFKQQMIRKITDEIGHKNQCAFVLKGSPLNLYLNQALLAGDKSHKHVTGFTLYQRNKAYFDQELFPTESDETHKAVIAQHLFSQMALYVPKTNRDTALESFFNRNMSAIKKYLKKIHAANNYVRFSSSLTADQLMINNHHIVITDDEISDPENKRVLSTLLNRNQNHKVVLEVGRKFVKDGCLYMKTSDLLEELAHLILTNTDGHVTSIGDNFLPNTQSLQSFDTAGLTSVTSIGNRFLFKAKALQSFDTAGLTNVISIGNDFLFDAQILQSFDTAGLTNVTFIAKDFFCHAWKLQSFNTTGLTNVISIGDNFLHRAISLQSFDTVGLISVTSIGHNFLSGAKALQSFNTVGLINVISIKSLFLFNAEALQSFDAVGLRSVKTIGDHFLHNAGIQSFDAVGLSSVETIGKCFLSDARKLQSFDIARLVNVKSIGDHSLHGTPWLEMNKKTFDDWKAKLGKQSNQDS